MEGIIKPSDFNSKDNKNNPFQVLLFLIYLIGILKLFIFCRENRIETLKPSGWAAYLHGFVCAYHHIALGLNPKHAIYTFYNLYY